MSLAMSMVGVLSAISHWPDVLHIIFDGFRHAAVATPLAVR